MAPIQVNIKHAGKTYTLPLDPDLPPAVFKDTVYNSTGVPPDRMKVMVKGGVLKVSLASRCLVSGSQRFNAIVVSFPARTTPCGRRSAPKR